MADIQDVIEFEIYSGIKAVGVPSGGEKGQIIKKNSNTENDTDWKYPDIIVTKIILDPIEEFYDNNNIMFYVGNTFEQFERNRFYICEKYDDGIRWKELSVSDLSVVDDELLVRVDDVLTIDLNNLINKSCIVLDSIEENEDDIQQLFKASIFDVANKLNELIASYNVNKNKLNSFIGSTNTFIENTNNSIEKINSSIDEIQSKLSSVFVDFLGSSFVGNDFQGIYWNGTQFVPQALTFADASWDSIKQIADSGKASSVFKVGDTKTVKLTTGEEFEVVILDFDHDTKYADESKAPITFGMTGLLPNITAVMNSTATNSGGWYDSYMRTYLNETVYNLLPDDLKKVIARVFKSSTIGNKSTSVTRIGCELWLFAEVELSGNTNDGYKDEGSRYAYYKTVKDGTAKADRIKTVNGVAQKWWLRTPSIGGTAKFRYIDTDGTVLQNDATNLYSICFGFCI
jgi:hypothetical protein